MKQNYPATEKMITIIDYALQHEYINAKILSDFLDCSYRQAGRYIKLIYEIKHEISFLNITRRGTGSVFDPHELMIRLNK